MRYYFISYAHADAAFTLRLADDLRDRGIEVWIDQMDLRPSRRWDRELEAALRAAAGVIVVLTPRSVASENVMDEVGFAVDQGKDVIPVLAEGCDVPLRINRIQRIDFTRDYRAALERCASALGGKGGRPAPEWDPETLRRAGRELTLHLGPIAPKLVEAAAAQARDPEELYRRLAERIDDGTARAAFLRQVPEPAQAAPRFDPSLLDSVTLELARVLGPISRPLVGRLSREARDREDLYLRVSGRVADQSARAALLERLRALA